MYCENIIVINNGNHSVKFKLKESKKEELKNFLQELDGKVKKDIEK